MIREKLYTCVIKEDPEQLEHLATQLYADRYDVLHQGMWRQYFKHELDKIEPARLVPGSPAITVKGQKENNEKPTR